MAVGKIFHWKHGWVPVSAEAKAKVAQRDADRRARFNDRENEKAGRISADRMTNKYRGNDSAGTPPASKITDRVKDGVPFTYEPGTGSVSSYRNAQPSPIVPGTETTIPLTSGRLGQTEVAQPAVNQAIENLITNYHPQILQGARITGQPGRGGYTIGMTSPKGSS